MSTFPIRTNPIGWNNIATITQQVELHPAFYSLSNQSEAKKILIGAPSLTYILWKDDQNHRYYLSFMNTSLEIEHRFFKQDAGNWSYKNGDPHRAPSIELLIPIIMHCKPTECRMVKRNSSTYNYCH